MRRTRRLLAALMAALCATTPVLALDVPLAAAEGGSGGASSQVVGRGDILTSILGWRSGRRSRPGSGIAPRCRWITMRDSQIEWLTAVSASSAAMGGPHPVLDSVRDLLTGDDLPDGDLQLRRCGGEVAGLRFVPRSEPLGTVEVLARRMITRLPVPDPVFSPPPSVAVPLHQPVFASIRPEDWTEVRATLHAEGLSAEVRAVPVGLRVISGDPTGGLFPCTGPARPFDPDSDRPVLEQAQLPDTCTFRYRSTARGSDGTPAPWIGTVTVLWEASWRVDGGEWSALGTIPRTRLFDRAVREVVTSIESTRR